MGRNSLLPQCQGTVAFDPAASQTPRKCEPVRPHSNCATCHRRPTEAVPKPHSHQDPIGGVVHARSASQQARKGSAATRGGSILAQHCTGARPHTPPRPTTQSPRLRATPSQVEGCKTSRPQSCPGLQHRWLPSPQQWVATRKIPSGGLQHVPRGHVRGANAGQVIGRNAQNPLRGIATGESPPRRPSRRRGARVATRKIPFGGRQPECCTPPRPGGTTHRAPTEGAGSSTTVDTRPRTREAHNRQPGQEPQCLDATERGTLATS